MIKTMVQVGSLTDLFELMAGINVMLAFANIIPIPGLDGGHLMFIVIEKVFGKKFANKYQDIAIKIGFTFLMILGIAITLKDVFQFDIFPRTFNYIKNIFS